MSVESADTLGRADLTRGTAGHGHPEDLLVWRDRKTPAPQVILCSGNSELKFDIVDGACQLVSAGLRQRFHR